MARRLPDPDVPPPEAIVAAAPEATTTSEPDAPPPLGSGGDRADPLCPDCGRVLALYAGDNPHKAGAGFCDGCGERKPLGS